MVRLLIRWVARVLAREIEKGSSAGAAVGALLGIALGLGMAYLITAMNWVGRDYLVAMFLICPIPLALGGALLGAKMGPQRERADLAESSDQQMDR